MYRGPLCCERGLQAATCYMNSLLQSLYFTPEFRMMMCAPPCAASPIVTEITAQDMLQRLLYCLVYCLL